MIDYATYCRIHDAHQRQGVGLYAGDFQGMEPSMQRFLRWVSFAVTTPVVFYSARPFFTIKERKTLNS